ncbi:MAG: 50S ribosomal protein L30 [Deltaproteobacteria bacterium]|nr:50S ribosomal protein L30 [Deltaproteobacteria bacterium]
MSGLIRITLEKGVIATPENHKRTVKALGLGHRHQSRILKDTPAVRGMIQNVIYLLKVEPVTSLEEKEPVTAFHSNPEYVLGEVKAKTKKKKTAKVKK